MHYDEASAADSIVSVAGQLPRNLSRLISRICLLVSWSQSHLPWWCDTSKNSTTPDVHWPRSGHVCNHRLCKRLNSSEPARRYKGPLALSVEWIIILLVPNIMQRLVLLGALISLVVLAAASPTPGAISKRSREHSCSYQQYHIHSDGPQCTNQSSKMKLMALLLLKVGHTSVTFVHCINPFSPGHNEKREELMTDFIIYAWYDGPGTGDWLWDIIHLPFIHLLIAPFAPEKKCEELV